MKYTAAKPAIWSVRWWLIAGLVMVFFQIFIGGVTRLTGSGLSITRWEVVKGTIPPLNAAQWEAAFDLYKATPQYQKINQGMTMSDFKFIYFWEYFHRLWARLMFFVFVIPFAWFVWRGHLSPTLRRRLLVVVGLAALEGFFGWIMVASGLIKRPWVNAYNLTLHLTLALIIFSYLLWTTFMAFRPQLDYQPAGARWLRFAWGLIVLLFVQLALGAMMSGTKAGLFYPTWPDMGGAFVPDVLTQGDNWRTAHFVDYDTHPFMPAFIQFLHRNVAYLITGLVIYFFVKTSKLRLNRLPQARDYMLGAVSLQVILGIWTLVSCIGRIPVGLGVAHQAGAVLLLTCVLYAAYQLNGKSVSYG